MANINTETRLMLGYLLVTCLLLATTSSFSANVSESGYSATTSNTGNTITAINPSEEIFSSSYTPPSTISATTPITLGVKFRPKVNGRIENIKFHKASGSAGTHVGRVLNASGTSLGSVTFTNETSSGWQTATLSPYVSVEVGNIYIVTVDFPQGLWRRESGYFLNREINTKNTFLVPADGSAGRNGVFTYDLGGLPYDSYNGSNYAVDFVMRAASNPRTTPFVQQNSGTKTTVSTSTTVTLPQSTTAGNTLLIAYVTNASVTTPAGWTRDSIAGSSVVLYRKTAVAGESSWTINNTSGSTYGSWWVAEIQGVSSSSPLEGTPATAGNGSASVTRNIQFARPTAGKHLLLALAGRLDGDINSLATDTIFNNGFKKLGDAMTVVSGASTEVGVSVAGLEITANGSTDYNTLADFSMSIANYSIAAIYNMT